MKYIFASLVIGAIVIAFILALWSVPSTQSFVITDTHDLSEKDNTLQTFHHGLGQVPTKLVFTAMTEGTTGQTYFSYDLNALGEKKGVGIIRLDDGKVMNGAYPFVYENAPKVLHGIDTIWAGQDLYNRTVAVFYSLDKNDLVLEWDKIGDPKGIVRFTIEMR